MTPSVMSVMMSTIPRIAKVSMVTSFHEVIQPAFPERRWARATESGPERSVVPDANNELAEILTFE